MRGLEMGGERNVWGRAKAELPAGADALVSHTEAVSRGRLVWFCGVLLPLSNPPLSHLEKVRADFLSSLSAGVGDVMLKAEQGSFQLLMGATSL